MYKRQPVHNVENSQDQCFSCCWPRALFSLASSLALSFAALSSCALNMATGGLDQWCCCGCQARPRAARRLRTAGSYLVFDVCAACGARAAAYEALFVQRPSGCQGFVLQIALTWVPVGLFLDVY